MAEINSASSLSDISQDEDVLLTADIHIDDFSTIENFSGTLNGNGHTIYNLNTIFINHLHSEGIIKNVTFKNINIQRELADKFGIVKENKGEMKSITVTDSKLDGKSVDTVGFISSKNKGKLKDCTVNNSSIYGKTEVGLISGYSTTGFIQDCAATDSEVYSCEDDRESSKSGGLFGVINNTVVKNCTITNLFTDAAECSGGIAGHAEDESVIRECVVKQSSINGESSGGIVCLGENVIVSNNSVLNSTLTGIFCSGGIIGKTSGENVIKESYVEGCSIKGVCDEVKIGSIIAFADFNVNNNVKNTFCENVKLHCSSSLQLNAFRGSFKNCYLDETWIAPNYNTNTHKIELEQSFKDITKKNLSDQPGSTVKVSKSEDLRSVSRNDTILLIQDIHIDDKIQPIDIFNGTFDGNGYTITGNSMNLIRHLTENGTLKDLNIECEEFTHNCINTGIVVDSIEGTVKNINANVSVKIYGYGDLGGIVGKSFVESCIQNCTISGSITGKNLESIGGIVYMIDGKVYDCNSDIEITGGGVIGGIVSSIMNYKSEVKNCKSSGSIVGDQIIGGIAGRLNPLLKRKNKASIENCTSDMYVSGNSNTGGIIGYLENSITKNSQFDGTVESNSNGGGIVGNCKNSTVEECKNTGLIELTKESCGGIIGRISKSNIKECINTGKVTGTSSVGGLIGHISESSVRKSSNHGNVNGEICGGLIGNIENTDSLSIEYCYNNSEVTGNKSDPLIGSLDDECEEVIINGLEENLQSLYWIPQDKEYTSKFGSEIDEEPSTLNVILGI